MSFREYEIRNKPLFASMKRAREALLKPHNNTCSVDDFFAYLENNYATEKDFIEFVTFYDLHDIYKLLIRAIIDLLVLFM